MKSRKHMPTISAVVAGVLLIFTCVAPCVEKTQSSDEHRAQELKARIEKALAARWDEPKDTRPTFETTVRQILDSLSKDEIRLVAQYLHDMDVEEEAFRRWARFDPESALKAVRAVEDANAAEIRLAGTGLEGGPGEAMSGWIFRMYLGALDGWSEVAPKATWESFKKREGPLSKSLVIEDYLHDFYLVLFNHLAKVNPDLAFQELIGFSDDKYEEMFTASMLAGYLRSAPRGRDWRKEATQLMERKWKGCWLYAEIRTALMGRWLEDSPEAAEKWFRDGDVEGLHWSYVESSPSERDPNALEKPQAGQQQAVKEKRPNDLGSAAGYWAARDFPAAWRWMSAYSQFGRKGFGETVLHGADVFLSKRTAYFLGSGDARSYILEQAARLPNDADRTKCASMIEQASDETQK